MKKINLLLVLAIFASLFVGTHGEVSADTCTTSIAINRAQVVPPPMDLIVPEPTGGAELSYDTVTNQLDYVVRWQDLTGPPTAAHFHGNIPITGTAGAKLGITIPGGATASGVLTGTGTVLEADESALINDAMWYINIHTPSNGGGEIRGNVIDFTCVPPPCPSNIILNELDADTPGVDMLEFVELFDGGVGNTPLDGCRVLFFNGSTSGNDEAYEAFDLAGQTTNEGGYFVLGNAGVDNVDFVFDEGTLQNGADAVGIYSSATITVGAKVTTTNLISALVYDTNDSDDSGLLTGLDETTQYNEDENGNKDTESIQRDQGMRDSDQSYFVAAPTPGVANSVPTAIALSSNGMAVGLTSIVILIGILGLTAMTLSTKRRQY